MKTLRLTIFLFTLILFGFAMANSASAANVYYSVGQNVTTHETGAGNVTVSGTTATFTVAQTAANMGVGDVIDYDSDNKKCYISGKTSTTVWSCTNATGGTPTAASGVVVNSVTHAFASLSAALPSGAGGAKTLLGTSDLTSGGGYVLNIPCYYDSGADTTAVVVDGWTTGANNYIKIYTPNNTSTEANQSQRHDGKYNPSKYRLVINTTASYTLIIQDNYVRVDGLQIGTNISGDNWARGVLTQFIDAGNDIRFSNNVIVQLGTNTGWGSCGMLLNDTEENISLWNNLVYDFVGGGNNWGIYANVGHYYLFNNTIVNSQIGIAAGTGSVLAKNNLLRSNAVAPASGTFVAGTDYNATNNASMGYTVTGGGNSHDHTSHTFTFTNETGDDFHLASTDAGAKDLGVSDPGSGLFSTDIDEETRSGSWDIGADEAYGPYNVYYSVGQSASDLKTGSPTISISSGVATLTVAQTGNIGVGDVITYDSTNKAYISGKTSATVWSVVTATGRTPPNVTSLTVDSIKHVYTTLSLAEAGASGANYLNTSDLVAGNYVLNIPCYYDSDADQTAVTVDGWTTGANNYIKIYTPNNTSAEVNQSQRHDGKWNTGKYRITAGNTSVITIKENYVRVDGLQIQVMSVNGTDQDGILYSGGDAGSAEERVSNCIFQGDHTATSDYHQGIQSWLNSATNPVFKIWNNTFYDFTGNRTDDGGIGNYGAVALPVMYAYNNTFQNCDKGIMSGFGTLYAKNNLFKLVTTAASGTFAAGTGYNATDNSSMGYTVTGGAVGDRLSQTFTFADEAGDDFHLAATDAGAKDFGTSSVSEIGFTTDIDNETRSGSWDIGADEYITEHKVKVLVVAGGGVGGNQTGGGGGGGGVIYNTAFSITNGAKTVTIGGSAQNSVFDSITALAGGAGGTANGAGSTGGSGGGHGWSPGAGASGTAGQGYAGGGGRNGSGGPGGGDPYVGGGGGGSGAVGQDAQTTHGGNGGVGVSNSISGSAVYYGGGGGGGADNYRRANSQGLGGDGGGGAGGDNGVGDGSGGAANGTAGTANTGGGGGGGNNNGTGGAGGSGIVIVSYATDGSDGVSTSSTGGTITTVGNQTIHTFTSSGTFTMISSAVNVYYSVGQSASDLKTNSPTVYISSGVATFSEAQTGNIGVGDILIAGGNTYYISAKQSTTVWNVVTNLGAIPSDLASTSVTSIKHTYTTLFLAEAGASGANYLNTSDLVAGNYVLNIPCYYDSDADQTAVTVDGWTTGANNYIKIYTPTGGSESNNSQRHDGEWNASAYKLSVTTTDYVIKIADFYVRIDGLQIETTGTDTTVTAVEVYFDTWLGTDPSEFRISNCIVKNSISGNTWGGISVEGNLGIVAKAWNNIVYDFADSKCFWFYSGTLYAFNNTAQNCKYGYYFNNTMSGEFVSKNNIAQDSVTDGFSGPFNSASDYNASDIASDAPGSHSRNGTDGTVTFINKGSDDFHLAATDAGARDFGASLAGDANLAFQTDIDGEQRQITWDIGADEAGAAAGITGTTVRNAAWGTAKINASQTTQATNGLVLMQSFDGPHMNWAQTSAEALDQSGLSHDGDVQSATATIGKIGQALKFSGDNYKVIVPTSTDFNFTIAGGFSNFLWFKKTGTCNDGPEPNTVFASRFGVDHGDRTWWFGCWGNVDANLNKLIINVIDGTGNPYIFSSSTINDGNWHFAGWVYDGTNNQVRLYVDGAEQTTAANIAQNFTSSNPFCIGSYDTTCGTYEANNTTLDEVRAYNRALSAAEADTLYRLGRANLK